MAYTFFYISMAVVWVLFIICVYFKPLDTRSIIIGISTVASSLVYDIILGDRCGLYHYISLQESTLYMALGAVFLYPLLNIAYTLFLPAGRKAVLVYTGFWIIAMQLYEYVGLLTGTIVFTGWKILPWSLVTYIFTYLWIYCFYRYLGKKGLSPPFQQ